MVLALLALLATPCTPHERPRTQPSNGGGIRLVDVTDESGITLENLCGSREKTNILEVNGNGAAFFDYDEDGDIDLLIANGSNLELLRSGGSPVAALYRNRGRGRFADVTEAAGLGARGWGMGVCVADVDNDGFQDVYVTARGPNVLYRNRGDGTFAEMAAAADVDDSRYGTGCSFGDYDRDGFLDLYVANYLTFDAESAADRGKTPDCQFMGAEVFCGPRRFAAEPDVLYRNQGDRSFSDVSAASGVAGERSYGFGVVSGDLDGDGWLDIYVANDSRPNFLFRNRGNGTFKEAAFVTGAALSQEGRQQAGMGVDVGDYDNDGWLDIFVTNFSHESNALYRGSSQFLFQDVSYSAGLGGASLSYLGWGTAMVDLDNDGWLDILVANGHIYREVDRYPQFGTEYAQARQLFRNLGGGRFADVSRETGGALRERRASRGLAIGDVDDDGDQDVFIVNLDERGSLLRNDSEPRHHWLRLRLIGAGSNRDAVGARVTVTAEGRTRIAEVRSGGSYLSHNDVRLHFGLGARSRVERLDIRWPNGNEEALAPPAVDRLLTVVEGRGIVSPERAAVR